MIPKPGIPSYTPSDEAPSSLPTEGFEGWKALTLSGQYNLVIRKMVDSGLFDRDELATMAQTYASMTVYYAEGAEDPGREKYHREIGKKLLSMIRRGEEQQTILRDPHHLRTDILLSLKTRGITDTPFAEMVRGVEGGKGRDEVYYGILEDLFNRIWTTLELEEEARGPLLSLLTDDKSSKEAARAVVGALFVGVMEFFDPLKIELLLQATLQSRAPEVRGSAVAALLFAARRHQEELMRFFPDLTAEARKSIQGDRELRELILRTIIETHISYDTEEDHRIFLKEILPTLQNVQNLLGSVPGKDIAERMKNLSMQMDETDERQAEMRRMMEQAASRLGSEDFRSHDLEYHNAMHMKVHPFFLKPLDWFLLFDTQHPIIDRTNAETMMRLMPIVFQGRQVISSDLYSYCLMVDWRPIAGQIDQLGQDIPESTTGVLSPSDPVWGVRDFVFGAYRFYHLFIAKDRFDDPFAAMPYLLDGAFTRIPRLYEEEEYLRLAGTLGSDNHYISAGYTYSRIITEWGADSAEVWRGLAVANIRLGEKADALVCLDRAIADEGLTAVTATNKANLLWETGRRGEAVAFLEEAEKDIVDPRDEYTLSLKRAKMLKSLGREEEARMVAFKADYLEEELRGKRGAGRFLLRLLLESGQAEEALTKAKSKEGDKLFLGLSLIANGAKSEGIQELKEWHKLVTSGTIPDSDDLRTLLKLLSSYDIPEWEQALIYDAVTMEELGSL